MSHISATCLIHQCRSWCDQCDQGMWIYDWKQNWNKIQMKIININECMCSNISRCSCLLGEDLTDTSTSHVENLAFVSAIRDSDRPRLIGCHEHCSIDHWWPASWTYEQLSCPCVNHVVHNCLYHYHTMQVLSCPAGHGLRLWVERSQVQSPVENFFCPRLVNRGRAGMRASEADCPGKSWVLDDGWLVTHHPTPNFCRAPWSIPLACASTEGNW